MADAQTTSDKRSSEYSENDLLNIMEQKDSENTKKATQAAVRVFETYLLEHAQVKLADGVGLEDILTLTMSTLTGPVWVRVVE